MVHEKFSDDGSHSISILDIVNKELIELRCSYFLLYTKDLNLSKESLDKARSHFLSIPSLNILNLQHSDVITNIIKYITEKS